MAGLEVVKAIGHHGQWGFSASFDFLEALDSSNKSCNEITFTERSNDQPINVLLVQPGDIRHVLYTIARRRRGSPALRMRPLHFYLLESPAEILARDLVLLELLNDFEVPIRQRATVFLEIYGNLKVQKRTGIYIEHLAMRSKQLMAKGKGILEQVLDFSLLRYRERDELERAVQNLYASSATGGSLSTAAVASSSATSATASENLARVFDVNSYYDHRQRALYETRFDSRKALFDWDYHSTIKPRASIIHVKQFRDWRQTGIAFEFGDQVYSEPNITLMTYTEGTLKKGKDKGIKKEVKGFWGDITCSPHFAFGIDCETPNKHAEGLFEILNKGTGTEQHRHHAVEVALYSVFAALWELETGKPYRMTKAHDVYSGLGEARGGADSDSKDDKTTEREEREENSAKKEEDSDDGNVVYPLESSTEKEGEEDVSRASPAVPTAALASTGSPSRSKITPAAIDDIDPVISLSQDLAAAGRSKAPSRGGASQQGLGLGVGLAGAALAEGKAEAAYEQIVQWEQDLVKDVQRAENVAEVFDGVKVFPLLGAPSALLDKSKYRSFFDGMFLSARAAQLLQAPFCGELLRKPSKTPDTSQESEGEGGSGGELKGERDGKVRRGGGIAAVETGKFLTPLTNASRKEFERKELDMAAALGWRHIPAPVCRRRRDEEDTEDDVLFFCAA